MGTARAHCECIIPEGCHGVFAPSPTLSGDPDSSGLQGGGAALFSDGTLHIVDTFFGNNHVIRGNGGAARAIRMRAVTIDYCDFVNNAAGGGMLRRQMWLCWRWVDRGGGGGGAFCRAK